ncbi:heterokaryon incompatibility protein-domain-containing protein [Annulohypoxylon stygium]|nr:heterokaryon incompatibility protein-domain-containing protein [Annulohypoxylon stygium]
MRLLHAFRRDFTEFIIDEEIPRYAILSHTWGEEEISFQEWQKMPYSQLQLKKGYRKISYCCRQALKDNIEWVWIDTCCIDKTSSAELSESINSMFRYRWYTRGWTLQELIAPEDLRFYSRDWLLLGSKFELSRLIYSITHIEPKFLKSKNLHLASVAKKMSWASTRKTSRVEDIAYSLLGIFDISMPLIYGEGKKAFRRLQEEIIKTSFDDHSIFAWGNKVSRPSIEITDYDMLWGTAIPWSHPEPLPGLLAESPKDFEYSGNIIPSPIADEFYRTSGRNVAALPLPVVYYFNSVYHWNWPEISQLRQGAVAGLLCCIEEYPNCLVGIPLQSSARSNWGRTKEFIIGGQWTTPNYHAKQIAEPGRFLHIAPQKQIQLGRGDIIIQRHIHKSSHGPFNISPSKYVDYLEKEQVILASAHPYGFLFDIDYKSKAIGEGYGFRLRFRRDDEDIIPYDTKLSVRLIPIHSRGAERSIYYKGVQWHHSRIASPEPKFSYVISTPSDIWELNTKPFPRIIVKVQRSFVLEGSFVDVVNIFIYDIPENPASSQERAVRLNRRTSAKNRRTLH